jgi:hypothetical protein
VSDPLKKALGDRQFTSDQEVKKAVHVWLATQPKTFLPDGISLCNNGPSVLKSKGTMFRDNVNTGFLFVFTSILRDMQ